MLTVSLNFRQINPKFRLVEVNKCIDDYSDTTGKVRAWAKDISHKQLGDPNKLATAIIAWVEAKNPPLRLPLGTDTIKTIENKNAFIQKELENWRELVSSTNF